MAKYIDQSGNLKFNKSARILSPVFRLDKLPNLYTQKEDAAVGVTQYDLR